MVTRAFYFKLNLMLIELEHKVDRVMVPLNRADQCNHICLYGKAVSRALSCLLSVPPRREGYGCVLP